MAYAAPQYRPSRRSFPLEIEPMKRLNGRIALHLREALAEEWRNRPRPWPDVVPDWAPAVVKERWEIR